MLVAFLKTLVLSFWCVGIRLVPTSRSFVHTPTWTLLVANLGCLAQRMLLLSGMLFVSVMPFCPTGTSSSTMHTGPADLLWGQWQTLTIATYLIIQNKHEGVGFWFCLLLLCVRPLWVEYPKDAATFTIDNEFLIGEWFTLVLSVKQIIL